MSRKVDYFATNIFFHLHDPIILSKKLGIKLKNCTLDDITKHKYVRTKVSMDLNEDELYKIEDGDIVLSYQLKKLSDDLSNLSKSFSKANLNKKNNIRVLSKKIYNQEITKEDLKDEMCYKNYFFRKNVVVEYVVDYEEATTYDGKSLNIPSEKRENEVIKYLNFIDYLLPGGEYPENYGKDFIDTISDTPLLFLSSLKIIQDEKSDVRVYKSNPIIWASKTLVNTYRLQNKNSYIKKKIMSDDLDLFQKDKILEITECIENIISTSEGYELFDYITSNLHTARTCKDTRTAILLLTSIIEALLTHNPNHNRYNVEDSINNQFCLKTCIALERIDETTDVEKCYELCKLIYDVRSKIAHGSVEGMDRIIKKYNMLYCRKEKVDASILFETIYQELSGIIAKILRLYLKDNNYINFLKRN